MRFQGKKGTIWASPTLLYTHLTGFHPHRSSDCFYPGLFLSRSAMAPMLLNLGHVSPHLAQYVSSISHSGSFPPSQKTFFTWLPRGHSCFTSCLMVTPFKSSVLALLYLPKFWTSGPSPWTLGSSPLFRSNPAALQGSTYQLLPITPHYLSLPVIFPLNSKAFIQQPT